MAKERLYKCRYKYCKHKNDLLKKEEASTDDRGLYYHPECLHEKETIQKVIDTYVNNVDPHPVMSKLNFVVNQIVYKRNVSADFLLFAMERAIAEHRLKHEPGLFYVVKDPKSIEAWEKRCSSKLSKAKFEVGDDYTYDTDDDFVTSYKFVNKKSGFGRILS